MKICKSIIIALIILVILPTSIFASIENTDKAQVLNELGLFQGTNNGYELDRAPTRTEAGVMLIRLLGVEKQAKEINTSILLQMFLNGLMIILDICMRRDLQLVLVLISSEQQILLMENPMLHLCKDHQVIMIAREILVGIIWE